VQERLDARRMVVWYDAERSFADLVSIAWTILG